jgi:acetolactate decarboxylase
MRTRSVPSQSKPYPPLQQVTQNQPEFAMQDVAGTIVGFRSPAYVKGINVPGYHLHFLSDDRSRGGHILNFEVAAARCQVDPLHRFLLRLPESDTGFAETDLARDRSRELQDVEMGRDR